jgi:AcrR family transcriptional regulator
MRILARHGAWSMSAGLAPMSACAVPVAPSSRQPGRTPHQHLIDIQRARILAAAVDTLEESGYDAMTVAAVIQRARVSRKTFYDVFASRDECFASVVESIFALARSVALAAYGAESSWLAAIRSALLGLLCLLDEEPRLARIWFVDAHAGPEAVHARQAEVTAMLVAVVDGGRELAGETRHPVRLTAEATVGGILQIVYSRLVNGHQEPFVELLGPCMYLITLPYLGVARATVELQRKPRAGKPRRKAAVTQRHSEAPADVGLRLTYRTTRALDAICEQPGVNNRMVAQVAGIKDQGQVSKLLSRLERLALIENRGLGPHRRSANAWHITPRGLELVRATNARELMRPHRTP